MKRDEFFTTITCDRCHRPFDGARIMSMFSTETICMACHTKEKNHPDYAKAQDAEHEAIRNGNLNFRGIGKPADL